MAEICATVLVLLVGALIYKTLVFDRRRTPKKETRQYAAPPASPGGVERENSPPYRGDDHEIT
jgi:hypothetical protein